MACTVTPESIIFSCAISIEEIGPVALQWMKKKKKNDWMIFHSLCIKLFTWMSLTEPEARERSFVSVLIAFSRIFQNLSHPVVWMVIICTPQILCFLLLNWCIVAQKNITWDGTQVLWSQHNKLCYKPKPNQSKAKKQYKTRKKRGKKAKKSKTHTEQEHKHSKNYC